MGYILVGSLTRLKKSVYKINGAEYVKVYIKHNGKLNPEVIPMRLGCNVMNLTLSCHEHDATLFTLYLSQNNMFHNLGCLSTTEGKTSDWSIAQ